MELEYEVWVWSSGTEFRVQVRSSGMKLGYGAWVWSSGMELRYVARAQS